MTSRSLPSRFPHPLLQVPAHTETRVHATAHPFETTVLSTLQPGPNTPLVPDDDFDVAFARFLDELALDNLPEVETITTDTPPRGGTGTSDLAHQLRTASLQQAHSTNSPPDLYHERTER